MIRGGAEYALGIYITGVDQGSAAECGGLKMSAVSHSSPGSATEALRAQCGPSADTAHGTDPMFLLQISFEHRNQKLIVYNHLLHRNVLLPACPRLLVRAVRAVNDSLWFWISPFPLPFESFSSERIVHLI
uniref:Uncharacterized protein n=1 Tax=Knipowitschia caucasica TaxID=637954 RepID=A0AAV2IYG3_KNICA